MRAELVQSNRAVAVHEGDRVTMFEVFFDLVFVFALTRVVELMAAQDEPASLVRGLLVLVLLWWAWCAFIWLGNQVRLDRGFVLIAILLAMAALFVAALVIPSAWASRPGDSGSALVLALAFIVVRASYVVAFIRVSSGRRRLRTQVLLDVIPQTTSGILLVLGAVLGGDRQTILWACAFVVDFGGGWLVSRYNGWRVGSPQHFAERHQLVLIIALGETLLSTGAGVGSAGSDVPTLVAALFAFIIAVALWRAYFGGLAQAAETVMIRAAPIRRPAIARDAYTLGNFPLIAGVVFASLGMTLVLGDIVSGPSRPAGAIAVIALSGGIALYLAALALFRWITLRRLRIRSFVGATAVIAVGATTTACPASVLLGLVALITVAAAVIEGPGVRWAASRALGDPPRGSARASHRRDGTATGGIVVFESQEPPPARTAGRRVSPPKTTKESSMSIQEATATDTRTDEILVEGDTIVYDVRGTGAPIVLLPGTPGDASAYGLIAGPLAADHTVITYDPRGFGRSTGREPRRYEIGQQARDVVAVLQAAEFERALFFGNSAGAEVGLELAKNHPEVVQGLVAHEPPVIRVLPDADAIQTKIAEIYRTAWTEGPKQAFFDFLLLTQLPFNAGKPFTQAEIEAIRPNADAVPGLDFADFYVKYQMLSLTSYAPDLAAIAENEVRVVAAAGEQSLELPFGRTSRRIADELGVPFATFPGHHGSHLDPSTADAWSAALRDALQAL